MTVELLEIRDFLARHHPFDLLPGDELDRLPAEVTIRYFRRGSGLLSAGVENQTLNIIRSGAVETATPEGEVLARLGEGEQFGGRALVNGGRVLNNTRAIEDCLIYQFSATTFFRLMGQYSQFSYYFNQFGGARLRDGMARAGQEETAAGFITTRARDLLRRPVVTMSPDHDIAAVARRMTEERVSCMLLCQDERLVGIVTDRDLRSRVVAVGRSLDTPVREVMTQRPDAVGADAYGLDVLLLMSRRNIHHVPVVEGDRPIGVITTSSLAQNQSTTGVYLVGDAYRQRDLAGLQRVTARVPELVLGLVRSGASAHSIGHMATSVADAVTIRLLQLAVERLGPAPVPWVWLALGSQARHEQTALSDQDNGLLLDDAYDPQHHGDYFRALATWVCDGLNDLGYRHCPGGIMASNSLWCQPLSAWKQQFRRWILEPDPRALMLSCIFFDLRGVHGEMELFQQLRQHVRELAAANTIYLAYMTGNALTHQPPLGFFRNFVVIRGGDHDHTLDLKHNGVVPIVDMARIHALAAGLEGVNSRERLEGAAAAGGLSTAGAADLLDALEFIAMTRLRHQARQLAAGRSADNFLEPERLSNLERSHLKDAFTVVRTLQGALKQRFGGAG
ncbi:MAG: DUF294 nucleotidyltransferase-like domain-containing protein [Magnetococcus sp. WYHC-3]